MNLTLKYQKELVSTRQLAPIHKTEFFYIAIFPTIPVKEYFFLINGNF